MAREGAPSGHRAGRSSGSSACPGRAASHCLRPQTQSQQRPEGSAHDSRGRVRLRHQHLLDGESLDGEGETASVGGFKQPFLLLFFFFPIQISVYSERKSFIVFPRQRRPKRRINPIDANKCLKPLSSMNGAAERGESSVGSRGICIQETRLWPRSLSVHCHFPALILCCSARHKLSRPASPSTSATRANPQIRSAFGGTKERHILQNKMSALHLQIQIQQQHTGGRKKRGGWGGGGARFKPTRLR